MLKFGWNKAVLMIESSEYLNLKLIRKEIQPLQLSWLIRINDVCI